MLGQIDVSVVIVNWNTRDLLLRCLASLTVALRNFPNEIWVVDNGSRDGSIEATQAGFPAVQIIANLENRGYAAAVNQALGHVSGRYVLLLNTDALPMADAIVQLVRFLDAHPGAAVAGGQLLRPDGTRQNSIANFPSLATELMNKSLLRAVLPRWFPGKERGSGDPVAVDSVVGACLLIRRDIIQQIGPLDERYFVFLEETDWCYRVRQAGYGVYHVPEARIYHLQGASARGFEAEARIEYHRSRLYFFRKHRGQFTTSVLAAGALVRVGVDAAILGLVGLLPGLSGKRIHQRAEVARRLFRWYIRGCPAGDGLPRRAPEPVSASAEAAGT